eukprot:1196077-Prorocentrum_minimum.AAC.5
MKLSRMVMRAARLRKAYTDLFSRGKRRNEVWILPHHSRVLDTAWNFHRKFANSVTCTGKLDTCGGTESLFFPPDFHSGLQALQPGT